MSTTSPSVTCDAVGALMGGIAVGAIAYSAGSVAMELAMYLRPPTLRAGAWARPKPLAVGLTGMVPLTLRALRSLRR